MVPGVAHPILLVVLYLEALWAPSLLKLRFQQAYGHVESNGGTSLLASLVECAIPPAVDAAADIDMHFSTQLRNAGSLRGKHI